MKPSLNLVICMHSLSKLSKYKILNGCTEQEKKK